MQQWWVAEAKFEFRNMLNSGSYMISVSVVGSSVNIEYALHGISDAEAFSVISKSQRTTIATVDLVCLTAIHITESMEN